MAAGATATYYCPDQQRRWARPGRSPVSTTPRGRRAPRAWGSPTACPASPARSTGEHRGARQRGNGRHGHQHARRPDFGNQPDRERFELHGHRRGRPLRQHDRTAFPGMTVGEGLSNYVLQATGTLTITASQAGYYTFGVNSDDGFSLTITGADFTNGAGDTTCSGSTLEYDGGAGRGRHPGHDVPGRGQLSGQPGVFPGRGRCEHGVLRRQGEQFRGGDLLRLRTRFSWARPPPPPPAAAPAHHHAAVVTSAPFTGTGSDSGAVRGRRGHERQVGRGVRPLPRRAAPRCTRGSPSTRANLASLSSLTLKMQYDDGYVAYLNGVEVASENAPSFAHVELAGQRGADQRRAGHDLRGRRRFQLPQFGHDRPPHGHRQRPGHPGPVVLDQRRTTCWSCRSWPR